MRKSATVFLGNRSKVNDLGVTQPDYHRLLKATSLSFKYIKTMEYDNTQCCYVTALNEFYKKFFYSLLLNSVNKQVFH